MAIALALAAALGYGAADFLGGFATKRSATVSVVVVSQLAGVIAACVVAGFLPRATVQPRDLAWGAAAGVVGGMGLGIFYRALGAGTMSIVAPVTGVATASVPVITGLVLGEHPGRVPLLGVALATMAIGLVGAAVAPGVEAAPAGRGPTDPTGRRGAIGSALIAGCCFGGFYVLIRQASAAAGIWPLASARSASICMYVAAAIVSRRSLRVTGGALPIIVSAGVLDMAANICYLTASHRGGLLIVVATLASLYPASTLVLARIVLRERLARWQSIGLALAGVAIVLIAAG